MRLNVMLEPQEAMTYADILAVARRAEELGFEGCYRSDHYKSVAGRDEHGSTDAWTTLAGLARETETIRLGTMVSPVTFRCAGNLAKVVATVDEMAGGARVDLGLGTGWLESEHRQYGFPFEDIDTRFARLEEHLQVVRGLWEQDVFTFDGAFVAVCDARFRPRPDPRPRIVVGGKGLRRTPALAARYADELNAPYRTPEQAAAQRRALDNACEGVGRDPDTATYSVMTGCVVGESADDFAARARRLQQRQGDGRPLDEYLRERQGAWVLGTRDRARERLAEFADAGVERVLLQHLLFDDLDMLDVAATLVG